MCSGRSMYFEPSFSALAHERRAEVDSEEGDHDAGDDRDDEREQSETEAAPCAASAAAPALPESSGGSAGICSGSIDPDYSITMSTRPPSTDIPGATATCFTRPAFGERSSFSIFIASTTITAWRAVDLVTLGDQDADHTARHRRDDRLLAIGMHRGVGSAAPRTTRVDADRRPSVRQGRRGARPQRRRGQPAVHGCCSRDRLSRRAAARGRSRRRATASTSCTVPSTLTWNRPGRTRSTDTRCIRPCSSTSKITRAAPRAARPAAIARGHAGASPCLRRAGAHVGVERGADRDDLFLARRDLVEAGAGLTVRRVRSLREQPVQIGRVVIARRRTRAGASATGRTGSSCVSRAPGTRAARATSGRSPRPATAPTRSASQSSSRRTSAPCIRR